MMNVTEISAIVQAAAAVISSIGIFYVAMQVSIARDQAKSAHKQSLTPVLESMLSRFIEQNFISLRTFIKTELDNELNKLDIPKETATSQLPKEIKDKIIPVSHYLDHLGTLVQHGYADQEFITGFIGGEVEQLWIKLKPHIISQRAIGHKYYQINFEWLAKNCGTDKQMTLLEKLSNNINGT